MLDLLIDGLLDFNDERYIHVWGAVRELHRHREPTRDDIIKIIEFVYKDKGELN